MSPIRLRTRAKTTSDFGTLTLTLVLMARLDLGRPFGTRDLLASNPALKRRGGCGPRVPRFARHAEMADASGAKAVLHAEVIPGGVEVCIVAHEQAPILKPWKGLLKLERHGFVGVITVV